MRIHMRFKVSTIHSYLVLSNLLRISSFGSACFTVLPTVAVKKTRYNSRRHCFRSSGYRSKAFEDAGCDLRACPISLASSNRLALWAISRGRLILCNDNAKFTAIIKFSPCRSSNRLIIRAFRQFRIRSFAPLRYCSIGQCA